MTPRPSTPPHSPVGSLSGESHGALAIAGGVPRESEALRGEHCTLDEYRRQLERWFGPRPAFHPHHRMAARFQELFPDLQAWRSVPLAVRVGWPALSCDAPSRVGAAPPDGVDPLMGFVSYQARTYLYYLVFTDRLQLDYRYLLGVTYVSPWTVADRLGLRLREQMDELRRSSGQLSFEGRTTPTRIDWFISRLVLHSGDANLRHVTDAQVEDLRSAIVHRYDDAELTDLIEARASKRSSRNWLSKYDGAATALYHAKITDTPARRGNGPRLTGGPTQQPRINAVMAQYLDERRIVDRPSTITHIQSAFRRLGTWLAEHRPEVATLAELDRPDLIEFLGWVRQLRRKDGTGPMSAHYQRNTIWNIVAFFRRIADEDFPDSPTRLLLLSADVPRQVHRVPRYIPAEELGPLMAAIDQLACPHQRTAMLVLRWTGARRDEVRRLAVDCLDTYADGTAVSACLPAKDAASGSCPSTRTPPTP